MRNTAVRSCRALGAFLLVAAACPAAKQGEGTPDTTGASRPPLVRPESLPHSEPSMRVEAPVIPVPADTLTGERATLARLEREARAIARTTGCTSASACRVAPVGVRACGGPRTFVTYCAATTDTVALQRKLRELERAERAWNERSGLMGTCEMRVAPTATLVGGTCGEAVRGAGTERVPQD